MFPTLIGFLHHPVLASWCGLCACHIGICPPVLLSKGAVEKVKKYFPNNGGELSMVIPTLRTQLLSSVPGAWYMACNQKILPEQHHMDYTESPPDGQPVPPHAFLLRVRLNLPKA